MASELAVFQGAARGGRTISAFVRKGVAETKLHGRRWRRTARVTSWGWPVFEEVRDAVA